MAAVAHSRREEKKPVAKEFTRRTRSGRDLTYSLVVIQEPERARACGSGAKSSADRRPVDPPPVVELRIFSGPEREDITFAYEANFFLFATLEAARPMARGRVQHAAAAPIPVLTGMPVSGMAYLDRPTEAGYFIFPDLSVRHEGQYCLSFNLYEETRRDEDRDIESSGPKPAHLNGPNAPASSFDFRLEIKSSAFTVFSAKKFPGLAESTNLSRTVAEQGCRVRIRRDVRMRRRDPKGANEYDEPTEGKMRGRRTAEEEYHRERTRSLSCASEVSPIRGDNSQYPGHTGPQSHLDFLDRGAAGPQFQTPAHFAPPPPPPPSQSYPTSQINYHAPTSSQFRAPPPPPPAPAPTSYNYDRQYPQSAYPTNPPREAYEPETRRASMGYPPAPTADPMYHRHAYHPPQSPATPAALPPLKLSNPEPRHENTTPLPSITSRYPVIPTAERPELYLYPQPEPSEARNGKRAFDSVFSGAASAIDNQRLANGQRPVNEAADDDEDDFMAQPLVYSRADGQKVERSLPVFSK